MNNPYATIAIHGGQSPDPSTGAILTPVYQTTTYAMQGVGMHKGFTYSRAANPTVTAFERALGTLEDAPPAVAFASGMAALTCLFSTVLKAGDHVLCGDAVYGGTVRVLREVFAKFGVETSFVDLSDEATARSAFKPDTRLVVVESPANPTLKLTDIALISSLAHKHGALCAVDNTFLTVVLQRPLDLGADLSVYSTTKYIEGHNATLGGAIVTRSANLHERLVYHRKATGSIQAPWDAWLTLRGLKTLPMRMREHSRNALQIALWLSENPLVSRVIYPGLASFPQRELAGRQQTGDGGIIVFEVEGGIESGVRFMSEVRLCTLAENLGAVETLVTHPATMTHPDVPVEQRLRCGITDGLIRLSVGLESPEDIIADLQRALGTVAATVSGSRNTPETDVPLPAHLEVRNA